MLTIEIQQDARLMKAVTTYQRDAFPREDCCKRLNS